MKKYRVIVTNIVTGDDVVKIIVNREQKLVIEHLFEHECFDERLELQIFSDDDEWKEFY